MKVFYQSHPNQSNVKNCTKLVRKAIGTVQISSAWNSDQTSGDIKEYFVLLISNLAFYVYSSLQCIGERLESQRLLSSSLSCIIIGLVSWVVDLDISLRCWDSTHTLSSSDACTSRRLVELVWTPFRDSDNIWKYAKGPQPAFPIQ